MCRLCYLAFWFCIVITGSPIKSNSHHQILICADKYCISLTEVIHVFSGFIVKSLFQLVVTLGILLHKAGDLV